MLKTAVIGATSYIGKHLIKMYRDKYPDCIGTYFSNKKENNKNKYFNIINSNINELKLMDTGHKSVIITAAQPNIGYCEKNPKDSYNVNVKATLKTIEILLKTSIKIIFLSSDYVFEGTKGSYTDEDITKPTTEYGKQKKEVEDKLKNISSNINILRLSKIYGTQKGDKTLLDEAANLLKKNIPVSAAEDQYFCPTLIQDLVQVIDKVQNSSLKNKINICSDEIWSRYNLILNLAGALNVNKNLVKKIKLYDMAGFKNRPLNTSMTCNKLNSEIKFKFQSILDVNKKIAQNYEI
jgi:dTDP-4-dehydrorhamnose reductase